VGEAAVQVGRISGLSQSKDVDISKPHSMTPKEIKATQNATATATPGAGQAVGVDTATGPLEMQGVSMDDA
jgi:hypothetical protein